MIKRLSMMLMIIVSSDAWASHGLDFNLGFSSGRLEQEQDQAAYAQTGQLTHGLTYSGLKFDVAYKRDLSQSMAIAGGFGFVTAFESLTGARSLKNGPFGSVSFYLLGGPKTFDQGHDILVVSEKASYRLIAPIYVRFETVDFQNSLEDQQASGVTQDFNGSAINTEVGLQYEHDIFENYSVGAGLSVRAFGVPMSKSKETDTYMSLYLSLMRYLD